MRAAILVTLLSAVSATAQDFIHYKFDGNCSNEVINYANGAQALASNGVLTTTSTTSSFDVGVFGGSLAGGNHLAANGALFYNRVTTGWNPSTQNVTGDLTMAWFMKERAPVGTTLPYLMGAPSGGFRLFTNGIAGQGLYQRVILASGGNGTNSTIANDFFLPATTFNIQTAAAAGWVHMAMVVDSTAQTATWYANGTAVLTLNNVPGALINAAGPFMIGGYSTAATGAGQPYDIDEFLMSFRAYSAAEILALSLAPQAGDGDYLTGSTTQCGSLTLGSSGGRPYLGNPSYALEVTPAAPMFYALLFGFDRCSYAGLFPLPMDGGVLAPIATGCTVLTDNLLSVSGVAAAATSVPFPISPDPSFSGLQFFSQGVGIDLATGTLSASNGFALQMGL